MNDEITRYALIGIDAEMAKLGELRRKLTEPPEENVALAKSFLDEWQEFDWKPEMPPDTPPATSRPPKKRKFSAAGIAAIRAGQLKRRKAEKRKGK